jgi:signal transduction histidine kinase
MIPNESIFKYTLTLSYKDQNIERDYFQNIRYKFYRVLGLSVSLMVLVISFLIYFLLRNNGNIQPNDRKEFIILLILVLLSVMQFILLLVKRVNTKTSFMVHSFIIYFIYNAFFLCVQFEVLKVYEKVNNYYYNFIVLICEFIYRLFYIFFIEFYFIISLSAKGIGLSVYIYYFSLNTANALVIGVFFLRLFILVMLYIVEKRNKILFFVLKKLKLEYARMQNLIDNIDIGIITVSSDESTITYNNTITKYLSRDNYPISTYDIKQFLFRCTDILYKDDELNKILKSDEVSLKSLFAYLTGFEEFKDFILLGIKRECGMVFQIYLRYNEIFDVLEFVVNDISVFAKNEEYNILSKYQSLFLSKICHELRNPITNIVYLTTDHSDGVNANKLKQIHNFACLMNYQIEDFDSLSVVLGINKDPPQVNLTGISINNIIDDCINLFNTRIEYGSKNIKLSRKVVGELPNIIKTDEGKLKQILINLLSNSLKFTMSGDIIIEAEHSTQENGYISICVSDTGKGIPKEEIDIIKTYVPFTKLEANANRYGLGMGLVIVKNLVQLIGLDLDIQSNLDKGTVVSFKVFCNTNEYDIRDKMAILSKNKPVVSFDERSRCLMSGSEYIRTTFTPFKRYKDDAYTLYNDNDTVIKSFTPMAINSDMRRTAFVQNDSYLDTTSNYLKTEEYDFRVIIIEDEKILQYSHSKIVHGYFKKINKTVDIIECCDGVEGLNCIYKYVTNGKAIDLILSDESMNFMRGSMLYGILKMLIAEKVLSEVKFYLVTSYDNVNLVEKNRIINKPLTENKLINILGN